MKLTWIFFALMVLVQWAAPVMQIQKHEQVLAHGEVVKFKCGAPDPFDPFRGRYLVVSVEDPHAVLPVSLPVNGGETVYASITIGPDGFATFTSVALEPPASGPYLRCKLPAYLYRGSPRVRLEMPFDRYYMNEEAAPKADEWLAKARRDRDKPTWVEVKLYKGLGVIVDIKHDNISVNDAEKIDAILTPLPAPSPTAVPLDKP